MASLFAGQWGPEAVIDGNGQPLPGVTVTLYDADGVTASTLWSSRTKATTSANPTTSDANGNVSLFAEPGAHVLTVNVGGTLTTLPITVPADPAEDTTDRTLAMLYTLGG